MVCVSEKCIILDSVICRAHRAKLTHSDTLFCNRKKTTFIVIDWFRERCVVSGARLHRHVTDAHVILRYSELTTVGEYRFIQTGRFLLISMSFIICVRK
jgi:hypothetical protein